MKLDNAIDEAYKAEYAIKDVCIKLNNVLNNAPDDLVEKLADVKQVIEDGKAHYKKCMGEELILMYRSLPYPPF